MCRRVTCKKCGKPTYAGCGQHIEQVLAGVPKSQRCTRQHGNDVGSARSLLARLLRRSPS
jgi:hypothetical protein